MPEVIIELAEGRTAEQKRALLREVTDAVVRTVGVAAESVVVAIHETPRTNKARGGIPYSER
jgi:4-oxalocrotonate tautomerase